MIQESLDRPIDVEAAFNPFPGLRPFEFHESHLFFGREGQSERLIETLGRLRFLAVVGTSGSGKSSLVRAGLLPALLGGMMTSAGSVWHVALLRPGNDPIGNLAQALCSPDAFGSEEESNRKLQIAITEATLRRGNLGLIEAVRQASMPPTENLLIIADQFEELFRVEPGTKTDAQENQKAAFVKLLLAAASQRDLPICVVLTMRSDYLGDCAQFQDLPEAINEGQYLIPRMTREQRREAITGPIFVGGAEITPRLVNRLLNDVGDNPDQLPILQHALMRAWDEWQDKRPEHEAKHKGEAIDLCCYEEIGAMENALSRHADEAYHEVGQQMGEGGKLIAEKMFKALTEKGADNREVRRPVTLGELRAVTAATEAEIIAVIETFRAPGRSFLMPPTEVKLNAESLIDISHESLIRNWKRLNEWVDEEARSARTYLRMAETAALHREGKAGLWRDPDLQIALDWRERSNPNQAWARRYFAEFDLAMSFLEQSHAASKAEVERAAAAAVEKEEQRKQELRRTQLFAEEQRLRAEAEQALAKEQRQQLIAQAQYAKRLRRYVRALALVAMVAIALAFAGLYFWRRAEAAKKEANDHAEVARKAREDAERTAEERRLALKDLESEKEALTDAQKTLEKEKTKSDKLKLLAEAKAWEAEEKARQEEKARTDLAVEKKNAVEAAGREKEAAELARVKEQEAERAADRAALEKSKAEEAKREAEALVETIKTQTLLATSGTELNRNPTRGARMAMHGLSKQMELRDQQKFAEGLNALRSALPAALLTNALPKSGNVEYLGFAKDGRIVTSDSDGSAKVWKVKPGGGPNGEVFETTPESSVSIAPDKNKKVNAVTVSADGQWMAIGQNNGFVKFRNLTSQSEPVTVSSHRHPIARLAFSNLKTFERDARGKDGFLLAASSVFWSSSVSNSEVKKSVWKRPNLLGWGRIIFTRAATDHLVSGLAFSDDGHHLAIARKDGRIELRDAEKSSLLFYWEGHEQSATGVAFDSTGAYLATFGSESRGVPKLKIWTVTPDNSKYPKHGMFENKLKNRTPILTLQGQYGAILDAAFSPDLKNPGGNGQTVKLIAMANQSGYVTIWELKTNGSRMEASESISFQAHNGRVSSIAFSETDQRLHLVTSGSDDQTTKLWEIPSIEYLRKLSTLLKDIEQLSGQVSAAPGDYRERVKEMLTRSYELLPRKSLTDAECKDFLRENHCPAPPSASERILR